MRLASLNWGGIAFVLLVWPLAWVAARILLKVCRQAETIRAYDFPLGRRGFYAAPAIAQPRTAPMPHLCSLDITRSRVTVCENGEVIVGCAMQGCNHIVLVAPHVYNYWTAETLRSVP